MKNPIYLVTKIRFYGRTSVAARCLVFLFLTKSCLMFFLRFAPVLFYFFYINAAFAQTPSPSFDCRKAKTPVETLICSDAALADLDAQLAKKFAEAQTQHPDEKKDLIEGQRKWLKTRDPNCVYSGTDGLVREEHKPSAIKCLQDRYESRLKFLSYPEFWPPFRESNVAAAIARFRTMDTPALAEVTFDENRDVLSEMSCRFFEEDPVAASKLFAPYYGSSMDAGIPICQKIDIEDRVPEAKVMIDILRRIRGEPTGCDGTIAISQGHWLMIVRVLAAIVPDPVKHEKEKAQAEAKSESYGSVSFSVPNIRHWSKQGNWEKRLYAELQAARADAETAMAQYYVSTFRVDEKKARLASLYHIEQLINAYAQQYDATSFSRYMSACFTTDHLDKYLRTYTIPDSACANDRHVEKSKALTLRRFLGLAIVDQYPTEVIKKLIADGAELDSKPEKPDMWERMDTPLMLAAPYPNIVKLLIDAGADVNAKNNFGKTPLMYAIQERNTQSVALLLDAGANANAETLEDISCTALKAGKRTPLMYAAWHGTPEIVQMLLEKGADIAAKDTKGDTALSYVKLNETLSAEQREALSNTLAPKTP